MTKQQRRTNRRFAIPSHRALRQLILWKRVEERIWNVVADESQFALRHFASCTVTVLGMRPTYWSSLGRTRSLGLAAQVVCCSGGFREAVGGGQGEDEVAGGLEGVAVAH